MGNGSKQYVKMKSGSPDDFQTPAYALDPLLPYIPKNWTIWEPACGKGNLVEELNSQGFNVFGTDIANEGCDRFDFVNSKQSFDYDVHITNPPFSIKDQWLEKCFDLDKPFALLLPLSIFDSRARRLLFAKHNVECIFPDKRINFETPNHSARAAEGKKSSAWFYSFWLTYRINIGRQLTFTDKP